MPTTPGTRQCQRQFYGCGQIFKTQPSHFNHTRRSRSTFVRRRSRRTWWETSGPDAECKLRQRCDLARGVPCCMYCRVAALPACVRRRLGRGGMFAAVQTGVGHSHHGENGVHISQGTAEWGQVSGRILVFCVKNHDINSPQCDNFPQWCRGCWIGEHKLHGRFFDFIPKKNSVERAYEFLFSLVKAVSMMTLIVHSTQCDHFPQWCRGCWTGEHKLLGWDSLILI